MYSIKNFKTFKGHEGEPCAQGTLHGPNGKAADWSDDSWGGPMSIHFVSKAAEAAFVAFSKTYLVGKPDFEGKPYDTASMSDYDLIETAVSSMSYVLEEEKELLKAAKKGIAYYRTDASDRSGKALYVTTAPYTPANVAELRARYADLVEIVNERLGLPLVDAEAHKLAEQNKRYKRLCRTVTLFSLREPSGDAKVMQSRVPYSTAQATLLRSKYPNLVEIINERYL